ncbi:LysR family transcriptional regulator [Paraburkholderia sp. MMS20-SJTR3]|uniref:LysR family transcriptional regulator n=1 Tax=Paraburkholderia sejongensis TaxID=2886946 RepID=A0ABS8K0Y9_9BURK|nr:LysR substrate-binding domain-containing protein [Paraburkholderia sp. MMS20-SJTR3]MCC8395789.1 LysR family transcriptional regulator [Paraburkholderia sp. MMS20-SJTR3]
MDWTHRLRLRHLQVLLSLAETGNLSQSAVALNSSQPGLSKWLKELEEDVGLPLFERHARGLRPTVYGEALIQHARRIEARLDNARDDMQALRDGGSGLVTIGTSGVAAADTVPRAVARLLQRIPRAQVRLQESTMNELLPQLARGELDIVVGRSGSPNDNPEICVETLYMEPINLVARPGHPLVGRGPLGWNDVFDYPWIVWPQGTPVRTAMEQALAEAGRTMANHHFVESNSSILNITLLNHTDLLGVASHRSALRFERLNTIRILPIELAGAAAVSMYWRAENMDRAAVALAIESLRECARGLPGEADYGEPVRGANAVTASADRA